MCMIMILLASAPSIEQDRQWTSAPPKELLALEQSRTFQKAHIEWTREQYATGGRRTRHTTRIANGDQFYSNRGDDDGVVFRDKYGNPIREFRSKVLHVLLSGGLRWASHGLSGRAQLDKADNDSPLAQDVRAFGLSPSHRIQEGLHSTLWRSGLEKQGQMLYATAREDGLFVVRGRVEKNNHTYEHVWWLDPEKNW